MAEVNDPRTNARTAIAKLNAAIQLHGQIAQIGLRLGDNTDAYQANWLAALEQLLTTNDDDFEFLSLIS